MTEPWIASSASRGAMRLLVEVPPERWPATVRAAAQLVDMIDDHARAGRDDEAADLARELEQMLDALVGEGIVAMLTS